jgi:RimJ/RimL family protein N-acetyltransferase
MPDEVRIRDAEGTDREPLFAFQREPEGQRMAAMPGRDREAFEAHWARTMADDTALKQIVLVDGRVAGDVVSWEDGGQRLVGYWIGREFWGRGVATAALRLFVDQVRIRPLHAHVAVHNAGSIRVLEKCGFQRVETEAPVVGADGIEEYLYVLP